MSVTLERCYSINKYIYVNSVDCEDTFDECRDPATGDYGVYCDGTFYSRCWNGTDYSCVVGDGCCGGCDNCSTDTNICPSGYRPKYLSLTFADIEDCPGKSGCTSMNGTYVLECTNYESRDEWEYSGSVFVELHMYGTAESPILSVWLGIASPYKNCFYYAGTTGWCLCSASGMAGVDNCFSSLVSGRNGTFEFHACDEFGVACNCTDFDT